MNLRVNILFLLIIATLFSCKEHNEYHSIIDKIESNSTNFKRDSTFSEGQFEIADLIKINDDEFHFYVKNRKNEIESYECSECHSKPVSQLKSENISKKAHWNIKLKHADAKTMSCLTCHIDNDTNSLQSITGEKIDFNLSYQLCTQCHNKEVKDWKGGAHGKNLSGWKASRVSKLCVECHDPHQPSFEKRWPARYNTIMANERK